jgi:hypothetical protein
MRALALLLVLAACGHHEPPPAPPPEVVHDAGPGCTADADHCCLDDGTVVVPGGCQPVVRQGTYPNVVRDPDGTCREIPCQLRCLPSTAQIATPRGPIEVSALAVGDPVWTVDARGARVAGHVLAVRALPVLAPHAIVELTLADGRVARASPEHPLAGGGTLGALAIGDAIDGSSVTRARTIPYDGDATWDLLPDGPTGAYWSDGVLLGSTLR